MADYITTVLVKVETRHGAGWASYAVDEVARKAGATVVSYETKEA